MIPFQPQISDAMPIASAIERLNGAKVSAAQLQAALERLSSLPAHLRDIPAAQALALQAFAREEAFPEDYASAALHARIVALARWTAAHDPQRQSNAEAVVEAAARFPLSESDEGVIFEPGGFQEMILFIEELPCESDAPTLRSKSVTEPFPAPPVTAPRHPAPRSQRVED